MPDFSIADILARGYQQRKDLISQPYGISNVAPALGGMSTAAFQASDQNRQRQSVQQAQQDYASYLATDPTKRDPALTQKGLQAAMSLGIQPSVTQPPNNVSPDIWNAIQKEGGFETKSAGTKENVAAGEVLARLKDTSKIKAQSDAKSSALDAKTKAGDSKFWAQSFRQFAPTNAPRGSLVGQAAMGNSRADRALTTLADPKITAQQIQSVVNDFAGIMQGGAPHADAMKELGFNTLASDWANLSTRIRSSPQSANQPDVVAKLKQMVMDIKEVDNKIIQNNLDTFEQTNSDYIERNPEKWNKIKASVMRGTLAPGDSPKGGQSPAVNKDPLGLGI